MKRILLVVAILCAASWGQDKAQTILHTQVGATAPRYQLFVNPNVRADTFLLDTYTGKVWRMTTVSDAFGEPSVWKAEDRIDDDLGNYIHKSLTP